MVQRSQFAIRRHHVFIGIFLTLFAFGIDLIFGKETGAMVVDVWIQVLLIEVVDERCLMLTNVAVAKLFAHNGTVFAFHL